MSWQFTHAPWLLALLPAWGWIVFWALKSDAQLGPVRRWTALAIRLTGATLIILAIAGLQWKRPVEGVNVLFLLDRSDSVPSVQQEAALKLANQLAAARQRDDRGGLLVFGTEAALETEVNRVLDKVKIDAVVPTERTDIAAAIRLGTAAFPETGMKRLVLLSDGNENLGDAMTALLSARPLGVRLDVVPLGVQRTNDISVQRLSLPNRVKKGQTFDAKIFVNADRAQSAALRIVQNQQVLGERTVQLSRGKNLFTFPQTLTNEGFYTYSVFLDAVGDNVPQNNQAGSFVAVVRGEPIVLVVSGDPQAAADAELIAALRNSRLQVKNIRVEQFPETLPELQDYDAVFLSNVAAGDLGDPALQRLQSAVRDFGIGLVCVGGDQTYAAGGYRGTPLEAVLPVNMELDSKKVLPNGAVALVMHGMEFNNGNQVARDCALGVLDALGPEDEMGVVLWNGIEQWLAPMTKAANKRRLGRLIAGMNQGDMPSFHSPMAMAFTGLKKSKAHIKHMIVFSDGDPGPPSTQLMQEIVDNKITVSTVLISGHSGPERMQQIAALGQGRYYDVQNPAQLPQIFIKEAAVILKSAIFEEPFVPTLAGPSEIVRGISEFPQLLGYVCTTPKARAELPLVSDKGDPVLAHWQFGLGRTVAFTSDAKAKWARQWLGWAQYRQFWAQAAQWSLRRLEPSDLNAEVNIDQGQGQLVVDALDAEGNYRNFLRLQATVVGPRGDNSLVRLEQTGPGHYEAKFLTKEVGTYLLHLMELQDGNVVRSQVVGANVNYSPEFSAPEPNLPLLSRLAEAGGGKILDPSDPADNPFLRDRHKSYQPLDWWEWLLKAAVLLFVVDVGVRRIQLERSEVLRAWAAVRRLLLFWKPGLRPAEGDPSLAVLLARRDQVRTQQQTSGLAGVKASLAQSRPELFQPQEAPAAPILPPASAPEAASASPEGKPPEDPPQGPEPPPSTTSRLLDAKRRARKRME